MAEPAQPSTPDVLDGDREQLRKEVLRLRDLVAGREAELATALGRVAELDALLGRYVHVEQRLNSVLESNTWRVAQAVSKPLRGLRRGSR